MKTKTTTEGPEQVTVCSAWREDLKVFADGELPFLRRFAVRGHLSRCVSCRDELREIERITMEIKASENAMAAGAEGASATLAPDLRTRILDGLSGVTPDPPPAPLPLWRRQGKLVFGGGSVLAGAMVCTFLFLFVQAQTKTLGGEMPLERQAREFGAAGASAGSGRIDREYAESEAAAKIAQDGPADPQADLFKMQDQIRFHNQTRAVKGLDTMNAPLTEGRPGIPVPMAQATPAPAFQQRGEAEGERARRLSATINRYGGGAARNSADAPTQHWFADGQAKGAAGSVAVLIPDRAVYREASLGVAVDNIETGSGKVEERVKAAGGYVVSNDLTTGTDGYKSAELVVKVPVAQFDSVLADLSKLGEVRSKHLTGKDITEDLSDATSDEQSLVNEVTTLDKKLKNEGMSERRTGQKEAELRALRMQLARTRARLGLLRKMGELSTLNVSLTEKAKKAAEAPAKPGWMRDLAQTNQAALLAFQTAIRVPIVLLVWVLAFSPLWAPLLIAYRLAARRGAKAER
jgi:hypothetical protein